MLKLDTEINLDIRPFFHWWGSQLLSLVPDRLREWLIHPRERLILSVQKDHVRLVLFGKQGSRQLVQLSLDEKGRQQRQTLFDNEASLNEAELVLRLSTDHILRRRLKLPAAAAENLHQVVSFEVDRLTPFKAEQVYFETRLLEKIPKTNQVHAELVLVPRNKLDDLLEALAALGLMPEVVDIEPADEHGDLAATGYNLLPKDLLPKKTDWFKTLNTGLISLLLLFLLLAIVLPIWQDRQWMQELQEQVDQVSQLAKKIQSIKKDVGQRLRESVFVLEKKQQEPVLVDMINELSRIIPDDTWLTSLQYKERRIQIQGQSPSASALIGIIEASPLLQGARFVSPVTQDRKTKLERFQIATEVVNGGGLDRTTHE